MKPFTISRVQEAPQVPEEAGLTGWWRCHSAEYLIGTKRKKKKICLDFPGYKALSVLVSVLGDIQGPQCQGNYC